MCLCIAVFTKVWPFALEGKIIATLRQHYGYPFMGCGRYSIVNTTFIASTHQGMFTNWMARQELITWFLIASMFERKKLLYQSTLVRFNRVLLLSWLSFIKMTYVFIYSDLFWFRHLTAPYITLADALTLESRTVSFLCYLSVFPALCLGLVLKMYTIFFFLESFQKTYL